MDNLAGLKRDVMTQQSSDNRIEVRAAIALRAARVGLGWSQEDASEKSGMSKTAIARIETLTGQASLNNIFRLIETYGAYGADISDLKHKSIQLTLSEDAILEAGLALSSPQRKRSDAGKKRSRKSKSDSKSTEQSST